MLLRASRQFARASRVAGNRQSLVHPCRSTTQTKIAAPLAITSSRHFSLSSSADATALNNIDSSGSIGLSRQALKEQGILDEHAFCVNFKTLHEMQRNACLAFASNELFGTHSEAQKEFEWMNYQDFCHRVHLTRSVLQHDLGCREFSKIGIIANNRWEWAAIACAAYSMNATIVPMYEAQLPADWTYILNDAGCDALFCATQEIFDTCHKEVLPYVSTLHGSMCLNEHQEDGEASQYCFNLALDRAEDRMQSTTGGYNDGILEPTPQDLADLVYTSGTTGKPKGVELTHRNIVSNIQAVTKMVDNPHDFLGPWDKSLAFLPWAHSYGQTCELWAGIAHGGSIGVCRGVPHILEDLAMVKPTILYSVPTLYKRVYDGVNTLRQSGSPLKQKLMGKAFELAKANRLAKQDGLSLGFVDQMQFNMLNSLILEKVRAKFGGNLRLGFLGGAACPKEILEFMDDLGIPIYEGYGLTETSPIITLNVPGKRMLGSVGQPLPGFNVIVCNENGNILPTGSEGEICCYGPSVMRGYHNKPKETMEVLSLAPDGKSELFHTGDMGRLGEDGYVRITGRIKEQYKLENGKYVVPTPIEESIGMSRFVRQVVLCGSNRPHNVALIVPEWDVIRGALKLDDKASEEELANDHRVIRLIDSELDVHTAKIKKFERPKAWAFVAPFTAANNMLTPKMSIRRHLVVRTYEDLIANLYLNEEQDKDYNHVSSPPADSKDDSDGHHEEDVKKAA